MQDNKSKYSPAIIISVALHIVLLILLGVSITSTPLKKQPKPQVNAIKAVVIDGKAIKEHADRIKRAEQDKLRKEQQRVQQEKDKIKKRKEERRQKELAVAKAKEQRIKEQKAEKRRQETAKRKQAEAKKAEQVRIKKEIERKKTAALAEEKRKVAAEKERQHQAAVAAETKRKKAEEAKLKAEQKRKEDEKKRVAEQKRKEAEKQRKAAEKERQRLAKIERDRQERLMQEQIEAEFASELDSEIQQLDAVRQQEVLSEVDKYTARIQGSIQRNMLTSDAMKGKSCALNIRLSDSGLVLSVTSGQGDRIVCRAGVNAVNKAGSLPMSTDPEVASKLKNINLIFRPEI